jgi:hypothetical protein
MAALGLDLEETCGIRGAVLGLHGIDKLSQPVNEPSIGVEREDDRLTLREQGIEIAVGKPLRMRDT